MTQIERSSRKVISGSGWANPLSHSFYLENTSHLKVYSVVGEVVELLQLGVNYTVSGVGDDNGYEVTILGDDWDVDSWVLNVEPPIDQPGDVSLGGTYGARFEDAIDRMANRMQSIHDMALRAVKSPLFLDPDELVQGDLVVDPARLVNLNAAVEAVQQSAEDAATSAQASTQAAGEATSAKNDTEAARDAVLAAIAALGGPMVYKGTWAANAGTFPGTADRKKGWAYTVTTGGTVGGQLFETNDTLVALVDNASTTVYAGNWYRIEADLVQSVAGLTGTISASGLRAALSVLPSIDEDDMASNSDTSVPTQQSVRAFSNAKFVSDFTALKALNTAIHNLAVVRNAARGGVFAFQAGDQSANITKDTLGGVWIAPNSDLTGASGAWQRQYDGPVNVRWFGAAANYVYPGGTGTDDAAAFQAALAFGEVYVPVGKYRINTAFYLPKGSRLVGPGMSVAFDERDKTTGGVLEMLDRASILFVNSAVTIGMREGSSIEGLAFLKAGYTIGADPSGFAGNAITIGEDSQAGDGWSSTDTEIARCFIGGFAAAVVASDGVNNERMRLVYNKIDCTNGFYLKTSLDICHIHHNHFFPFLTAKTASYLERAGTAIYLEEIDWPTVSFNFSYGYTNGIVIQDCDYSVLVGNSCDTVAAPTNSPVGINVLGTSKTCTIMGSRLTALGGAIFINGASADVLIQGCQISGAINSAIKVQDGRATILGNTFYCRGGSVVPAIEFVSTANAGSVVDCNTFNSYTAAVIVDAATANYANVGRSNSFVGCTGPVMSASLPPIASAATLQIPYNGNAFIVTGTTTINGASGNTGWAGRTVTLYFAGNLTINGGTGLYVYGAPLAVLAGLVIELVHDGSQWITKAVYK